MCYHPGLALAGTRAHRSCSTCRIYGNTSLDGCLEYRESVQPSKNLRKRVSAMDFSLSNVHSMIPYEASCTLHGPFSDLRKRFDVHDMPDKFTPCTPLLLWSAPFCRGPGCFRGIRLSANASRREGACPAGMTAFV